MLIVITFMILNYGTIYSLFYICTFYDKYVEVYLVGVYKGNMNFIVIIHVHYKFYFFERSDFIRFG